ncbi:hypothetical protein ACHAWO_004406 [Cyclotella atomus]|uniref:Uncharacterized protein n=1 Tax=Cyclotella atomus TaxID=382360 RepID=A0ABD3NKH0_9STRA
MCHQTQSDSINARSCLKKISDNSQVITVPTFNDVPTRRIDIAELSSSEISSLKFDDPFMYYSFPSVREAYMRSQEADLSALTEGASATNSDENATCKVTRQRRVSTECHPDLLLPDLNDPEFVAAPLSMTTEEDGVSSDEEDETFEEIVYLSLIQMK